jgi:hypothetical protein
LRRIPVMVSFLTHSGHLAFAAGTALHAPKPTPGAGSGVTVLGAGPDRTCRQRR